MTTHSVSLNCHRTTMMLSTVLAVSLWYQTKSLLADEGVCRYGPNDCQSRGTLLQWSYGASFSGGPNLDEPLVTDRLGAYTEWFSLIPNEADTFRTQSFFNGGFTFLLSDDVQWDIRAGVGLNDAADDFFTGTGLSIRLR